MHDDKLKILFRSLHRDKALHFNRMPVDEEALMEKLHQHFDFPRIRRKLRAKALLALVIIGVRNGQWGHFTSYSRREGWYTGLSKSYGATFTYSHIIGAFEAVRQTGMFINLIQTGGTHNTEQSVFMASPELIAICADITVIEKRPEIIIVKDDDGRPIQIPDTPFSLGRRQDLQFLNMLYDTSIKVSFNTKYHQYGNWYHVGGQFVEVRPVQLYSIFNRASFDCGGRIYGWHTNLKKEARSKILLNGEECQELDYKQLHPTMLFAKSGRQIDRDIYSIGNLPRGCYKKAFLASMNGTNVWTAGYSLWDNDDEFKLDLDEARYIVGRMVELTPELKDHFFSDMGVKLQREDSEIILSVMKKLASLSIANLSVHDSVIVPVKHVSVARDIMLETYSEFYPGYSCAVSQ